MSPDVRAACHLIIKAEASAAALAIAAPVLLFGLGALGILPHGMLQSILLWPASLAVFACFGMAAGVLHFSLDPRFRLVPFVLGAAFTVAGIAATKFFIATLFALPDLA